MLKTDVPRYSKEEKRCVVEEIESFRKQSGARLEELTTFMGVSKHSYLAWKSGRNLPVNESCKKIKDFLGDELQIEKFNQLILKRKKENRERRLGSKSKLEYSQEYIDTTKVFLEEIYDFMSTYNLDQKQLISILNIGMTTWERWTESLTIPSPGKMFDVRDNMRKYKSEYTKPKN